MARLSALPAPAAAVVLDLPGPGPAAGPVGEGARGEVAVGRPAAPAGQDECGPAVVLVGVDADVGDGGAQRLGVPAAFGEPVVARPVHLDVPGRREGAEEEAADGLQDDTGGAVVAYQDAGAQHREAVGRGEFDGRRQSGDGVVEVEFEEVQAVLAPGPHPLLAQPCAGRGAGEARPRPAGAVAERGELDQGQPGRGGRAGRGIAGLFQPRQPGYALGVHGELHPQGGVTPYDRPVDPVAGRCGVCCRAVTPCSLLPVVRRRALRAGRRVAGEGPGGT